MRHYPPPHRIGRVCGALSSIRIRCGSRPAGANARYSRKTPLPVVWVSKSR